MKIEKNYLEDHQLELRVEADQELFDKAKHIAAKQMAKNTKIPGYRPGKAPYQLIVNHFGEAAVIDRALDSFLDDIYPKILDEADLQPYGPGQVKEIQTLEPPTLVFEIPLQPEVDLGDYETIRVPFDAQAVGDDEVEEVVNRLRTQQAGIEPVDHPAEEGNLVDTSLSGYPANADPNDEDQYLLKEQPLPVMIKEEKEETEKEWPFPGFSRQLLGVSPGDVLELTHEYPDDETVEEEYRGKDVLFKVAVEGIRKRVLPDFDEEFVKSVSDVETVDEFIKQINEDLVQQREMEDRDRYLNTIFEKILENATIHYPPQMLDDELDGELKEIEMRIQAQGMDLETYLDMQDLDEDSFRENLRPNAKQRIERGLIIGKISEVANLDISPDDITAEYQRILNEHFRENEEGKEEFQQSQESLSLLNQISSQIISKKTLDYLVALAKGEDITSFLKQEEDEAEDVNEGEHQIEDERILEDPPEDAEEIVQDLDESFEDDLVE